MSGVYKAQTPQSSTSFTGLVASWWNSMSTVTKVISVILILTAFILIIVMIVDIIRNSRPKDGGNGIDSVIGGGVQAKNGKEAFSATNQIQHEFDYVNSYIQSALGDMSGIDAINAGSVMI